MSQSTPQNAVFTPLDFQLMPLCLPNKGRFRTVFGEIMEKFNLPRHLKVFGVQVRTFPAGVGDAFKSLMGMFPKGDSRSYYGISEFAKDGSIVYYATAEETYEGEAEKYNCNVYVVKKGEYLSVTVSDWMVKTDSIKDVFENLMKDVRVDKTNPCMEWYKTENEMLCMMRMDEQIIREGNK